MFLTRMFNQKLSNLSYMLCIKSGYSSTSAFRRTKILARSAVGGGVWISAEAPVSTTTNTSNITLKLVFHTFFNSSFY